MAKSKTAHLAPYQFQPRASAPVIIRERVAAAKPKKQKRHSRRGHGGGAGEPIQMSIGGFLVGILDKQGTNIPTVPMLGRAGTLALGLHFLGRQFKSKMVNNAALAAAAIAGYELGRDGSISGSVLGGGGVAAQV